MNKENNNIKINEIKQDRFVDKIYNNTFFLITISVVSVIFLLTVVGLLIASFTVWK